VSSGNPFSIGFRAARANLVPGLLIQALMVAVVLAYYFVPSSRLVFRLLADAKGHWGFALSFTSAVVAGAVLPVIFKIVFVQHGRFMRANVSEFLFLAVFWGLEGIFVDTLYRLQAVVFGAHVDVPTVCKKVLADMFIFNPFFAVPFTLTCYELKSHGYDFRRIGHVFTAEFYRRRCIPALCATWGLWIPVTSAVYSLPSLLQIPLFALALTFWVLMVAYITARHQVAEPGPLPQPIVD